MADVNAESGEETVSAIMESGGDATFVRVDVTTAADVEAMVSEAVAWLVLGSGIVRYRPRHGGRRRLRGAVAKS